MITTQFVTSPYDLYKLASFEAEVAAKAFGDNGYGCGSSFVTIKWGTPFMKWARKEGIVKKDAYYGWILDTKHMFEGKISATLTNEEYNKKFAQILREYEVHAFNHTYLT